MTGTKAKRAQAVSVVASESIAEGAFWEKSRRQKDGGRQFWERVYIDIVFISRINIDLRLKGLKPAVRYADSDCWITSRVPPRPW